MIEVILFAGVAIALLVVLLWLANRSTPPELPASELELPIEKLVPLHCRHFPEVRQALSMVDRAYLRDRLASRRRRHCLAERRAVLRQFLCGVRQDFVRLDRLGRTVAALSPQLSRKLEGERFWLGVRFRALFQLVRLRLELGLISVPQVERLTQLVGSLAARIEATMAAMEEASLAQFHPNLSA